MKQMKKNIKDGHGKILGHLEQDILDVLWARGEASGKEIFGEIKQSRAIAITTVLTVLERLCNKGLISKIKGESVFIFRPVYTREEFACQLSNGVLRGIIEISASGAAASFVDMLADTDPAELDRLAALIRKKKEEIKLLGRQGHI